MVLWFKLLLTATKELLYYLTLCCKVDIIFIIINENLIIINGLLLSCRQNQIS